MRIYLFLFMTFLCSTICIAQKNISIHLRDENNKPISFYTIENVKYKTNRYAADSLGIVNIPGIVGMSYNLHAVGFRDTLVTIQNNSDLNIRLKSNNLLNEVVVRPVMFSQRVETLKSSRTNEFNWYAAGNASYNHEIGRVISINEDVWLQTVSFKIKSRYEMDFKKNVFVNIYRVGEKLRNEIEDLKNKKIWTYRLSFPDLLFSSHLSVDYNVSLNGKYLTFDLSKEGIYLDSGQYIVVMELMQGTTRGIMPYFSLSKECLTLRSNNNAKVVAWGTEIWEEKYMNLITDLSYFPKK